MQVSTHALLNSPWLNLYSGTPEKLFSRLWFKGFLYFDSKIMAQKSLKPQP